MNPIALHAGNPGPLTGAGNWTYFIDGELPVLIDAGVGEIPHLDDIDEHANQRQLHLVVTHAHSDHIAGAPAIVGRRPDTRLSKMPWAIRDRELPWSPLADGDLVATGEGPLEVIHTPGHAPDHVCLWHAESRTLFVGDMLVQGSTVFIPASHGGSITQYLASLERLRALRPLRAMPAHGPVITDPEALIDSYLAHRREREVQVLVALESGAGTLEAIVTKVYPDVLDSIRPFATESALAHLHKLEDDERVVQEGARWRLLK
jgi:glyoxylase-like metal-dependent hydrolase (beta-lactamase superfamily II)